MIVNNIEKYDGSHLRSRFAYDHFKEKTQPIGNIIVFRAPIIVEPKDLIDKDNILEDHGIYADDAINFCMEIPNISLFAGICFHRLFNAAIGNILASEMLKCDVEIDGTRIIIHKEIEEDGIIKTKGKASVSDSVYVDGAVLLHTGINIVAGKKAPATAFSTNLDTDQVVTLSRIGIEIFYNTMHEIFVGTTKNNIR